MKLEKVDMIIFNVLLKIGLGEKDKTNDNNIMINPNYLKYIPYAKKGDMHQSLIIGVIIYITGQPKKIKKSFVWIMIYMTWIKRT